MDASGSGGRAELRAIARRAMAERGLDPDFPPPVLAEVAALGERGADPGPGIRDLRGLAWVSIDNSDTRDLDQLSVAEARDRGVVKLCVAVADVDATVAPGSAIDAHARANTTSVYTAAEVFPMLPERLSTDLTSLGEGADRLAIVVEMAVGADGAVQDSDVYRALVRNQARLEYDSVAAWLDGHGPAPPAVASRPDVANQLRLQGRLAAAMQELRHHRGALTLETTESHAVFDGELLAGLRPDEKNPARELIEDFMIAANVATARFLEGRGFPVLRRVLRAPERWDRIVALAAGLGEQLPREPSAPALQAFLMHQRAKSPRQFADVSLSVVKLLGSGEYAVEMPGQPADGHFGLAVKDYTHSTAPNRRFPDLVTQRLVKAALAARQPTYGPGELSDLAAHCTRQEDNAAKVERQVRKSAAALLLAPRVGQRFDAIVTGAGPKGTWVRVLDPAVEGRVERGEKGLDVGDHVTVQLLSTDVERGYIDFARV
jgi:VacB/RNase II family 3'-5' exoribonuclease